MFNIRGFAAPEFSDDCAEMLQLASELRKMTKSASWKLTGLTLVVLCRAGTCLNTRYFARLWGALAHCNFEPGPSSGRRSGPARLGLKPGLLVCSMGVRNTALTDTAESVWIVNIILEQFLAKSGNQY